MKRISGIFLMLLFAVLMVSCKKETEPQTAGADLEIKAMVYANDFHRKWTADDCIAVFDGVSKAPALFRNISGEGEIATFMGEVSSSATQFVAAYPYSSDWKLENGIPVCKAPSLQFISPGKPQADSLYTTASAPAGGSFNFVPRYSLISFDLELEESIVEMTLTPIGDEFLGREQSIKLTPSEGEFFSKGHYIAIVTPQTVASGLHLWLKASNGKMAAVKLVGPLHFEEGKEITINPELFKDLMWGDGQVILNGTKIDVNSSLYGLVSDSSTGIGISGVPVSDGYQIVVTDSNGVYQMRCHSLTRKVFYTLPAGYEMTLDPVGHRPGFYTTYNIDPTRFQRYDFSLKPCNWDQGSFTFIGIGDPQCAGPSDIARYTSETIPDIVSTLNAENAEGRYLHPYAVALGDIGYDNNQYWPDLKDAASNIYTNAGFLPLFHCMGNHDHDSTTETDYDSCTLFSDTFGPQNYSFNIGKTHIVVMDNVRVTEGSKKSSSHTNKFSWNYSTGFTPEQMDWLRKDLSLVDKPSDKLLIFCVHIPFYGNSAFASEVAPLFKDFHETHIMSGHTHYPLNQIHSSYVCKGGLPIYEHVHGAACGAFWSSRLNGDGQPNGYSLFEVDGNSIVNWVAKGVGEPFSFQMRVYDGNQMFTGKKGYEYYWYKQNNPVNSTSVIASTGDSRLKGCFVVSLWNDDMENWTVELWQNGQMKGRFHRMGRNECCEIPVASFNFNQLGKNSKYYNESVPGHIWYYKPESADPSSEEGWKVVATQKIPGSSKVNVYECDRFQTDYTGFAK